MQSVSTQPVVTPIKKKRGGYRPGSGRKRIHPIKTPKSVQPLPSSPHETNPTRVGPNLASQITPTVVPHVIQATTLPSIRSLTQSLPPISSFPFVHSTQLSANKPFQPAPQSTRDVAMLIQLEHQKMISTRIKNEELSVQDFEVELLLGLEREVLSSSPCSSDSETVPFRHTRTTTSYEHLFESGSEEEISFDSQDEDFYSRKRRATDLDRSKKCPSRVFTTAEERDFLEAFYQVDQSPSLQQMEELALKLRWPLKRMKQWFSNKRSYGKRKQLYVTTGSV